MGILKKTIELMALILIVSLLLLTAVGGLDYVIGVIGELPIIAILALCNGLMIRNYLGKKGG